MMAQRDRVRTRVNGHEADVCERAVALRWELERDDRNDYDALATVATPDLDAGTRVETKSCRPWIANGDQYGTVGRFHLHRRSHQRLLEATGWYALVVYDVVENPDGQDHVLIYTHALYPAHEVDDLLPDTDGTAVKLPWPAVFDGEQFPDRELHRTGGAQ